MNDEDFRLLWKHFNYFLMIYYYEIIIFHLFKWFVIIKFLSFFFVIC